MKPASRRQELPTIWEVPDALWEHFFVPLLAEFDPPPKMGRPRANQRLCLDGIIYRARTGCQWNQLPEKFGNDTTVFRTLRRWDDKDIFDKVWALLLYHCEDLKDVHWEWQAADGCLHKARFVGGGTKGGIKRASQKSGGTPKKPAKGSGKTPVTGEKWGSKPRCLSRREADRWLFVSPEPM